MSVNLDATVFAVTGFRCPTLSSSALSSLGERRSRESSEIAHWWLDSAFVRHLVSVDEGNPSG